MPKPPRKLLVSERHRRILERVSAEGFLDLNTLAAETGVSVMTIRRDVQTLSKRGNITITRGGATAIVSPDDDMLTNPRAINQTQEKAMIGQFAAQLVKPDSVIFIGTGSTTAQLIQFLDPELNATVITPSLPHATVLTARGVRVISTGGLVVGVDMAQSGPRALESIRRYDPDITFIGAQGVSASAGLTEMESTIAELNQAAVTSTQETVLLVDSTKIGVRSPYRVCALSYVSRIVTTKVGEERLLKEDTGTPLTILVPER